MHKTLQKTCFAAALALVGAIAAAAPASAMPVGPAAAGKSPLLQSPLLQDVRDGCGRGYRPNDWGRCVPERYQPRYDNGYGGGYGDQRYGGGYDDQRYGGDDNRYRNGYGDDYQRPRHSYRNGCPPGRHPGNSGRCVKDY
ncbi:hypothetical protein GCM10007874_65730 [Labrys miyagiensis]|uniref:Uncharacterized protein n=1 Tax=Labrys miyagiensis TaxID=346912 RepID=A0ABQ6CT76_9HYPH|nr:hypothetical protein [Labrys miyagiensis]GLS23552.1 hypothetical protein GCM10007874_65730 [Labrys miyagiensis]